MTKTLKKTFMIIGIIIAVLLLLALAAYLALSHDYSGSPPVSVSDCTNPHIAADGVTRVSAHRSGGGIAPENTLMAFKNCVEDGSFEIDIFEFDVHITADGQLVLLHDDTLDRTSNAVEHFGHEYVRPSEYTYQELYELNMGEGFVTDSGETPYKGLRGEDIPDDLHIMRVQDVFSYLSGHGDYDYIIEIKDSGDLGYASCDELYRQLEAFGLLDDAVIGTFNAEVTEYMEANYPDMLRSASVSEVAGFFIDSLLGIDREDGYYKFEALQIPTSYYNGLIYLGSTRLINAAHEHNIAVQYWTINDAETVAELAAKGADAIMTDYPDMAYEVLRGGE